MYGSKGVWHGGGWGPRYLVPALPFVALWALPVAEAAFARGRGWLRAGVAVLVVAGVAVQVLGVAKHPNRYTVMFRDHILPGLPAYGAPWVGRRPWPTGATSGARRPGASWPPPSYCPTWRRHRREGRGPAPAVEGDAPRGLGYAFAETGALSLRVEMLREVQVAATVYACDWDHRERASA